MWPISNLLGYTDGYSNAAASGVTDEIGHAGDVDHFANAVHADDVGAQEDTGGDGGGRSPFTRLGRPFAKRSFEKRLPRRPQQYWTVQRRERIKLRKHRHRM